MRRRTFVEAGLGALLAGATLSRGALAGVYAGLMSVDADLPALTRDNREQVLPRTTVQELADAVRGNLLLPGNAGYDVARQVLNPDIDKHPALIVQPSGTADVISAVQFARDNNLLVAVKCGGHSYAGKSTINGGLMLDLSTYRNTRVARADQRAFVTGGCLLGHLDHESMAHGMVTTAGTVSHTGVGGLATAGGFGRLGRRFGLSLDNIVAANVVAADGRLYHASADENPDLYWGVRGGGGNFGVVTNFEFALHPMSRTVIGGNIVYPFSRAREVMDVYAEYSPVAPDDLYLDLVMVRPPGGKDGVAILDVCYSGPPEGYERAMRPFTALGAPLANQVKPVDYVALQRSGDTTDPRATGTYMKGGFISELPQKLVDTAIEGLEADPNRSSLLVFQHAGGAISRVPADATAFAHRYASHNMLPMVAWPAGADRSAHVRFLKQYWASLKPFTHGFYSVEVDEHSRGEMNQNYQGNYPRLAKIKHRYDPENIFRLNANITPAA